MKKITTLLLLFIATFTFAQQQAVSITIAPTTFEETTSITINVEGSSVNEAAWGVTGNALYLWAWSFDINDANIIDCPTNGAWTSSSEANRLTYNSATDRYSITFTPKTFYNRPGGGPIGRIGLLIKAKDGSGDKKSQDVVAEVGTFQVNLTAPLENSTTLLNSGASLSIAANNTGGTANYNLLSNGVSINTASNIASYSFTQTNITSNQNYTLEVTQGATTISKKFSAVVNPTVILENLPAGLEDGINYNPNDATKATLVLNVPLKDYVYVAGSFNNWQPTSAFAMKKDPTSGKFWLELTGLVSGQSYSYQYWVVDQTPIANSPSLVKTADPFSTLVLSPFDDPGISATTYPNLPAYPQGQSREVTVLQTGQTPYNWQVTNFNKPDKDNLVVYEALVRDFDANRNYQDLINRIDYFKSLKINALQLMPVMEFEGNESWGYNTAFHMANDKFYGPGSKLKELIDLCHQNGIAVILDIALNHAFGRNPMVRMWMKDADGDGWGDPSSENPYFNEFAKHSYNVGSDFNHQQAVTKNYVKRVVKHWIQEYKIDGFRWDLTKGFTQNCSGGDENCTNSYQQDRVDVLKEYADYAWLQDPTHIAIFEHLGGDNEEQQWANYRVSENPSKGIMMWGKLTDQYNQLSMGFNSNNDISRIGHKAHAGFTGKRVVGYPESHDEERLMYKNLQSGNSSVSAHNVRNIDVALSRMSAIGAVSILVPGPKMIWQFGELGWENSIFTCNNGVVNTQSDAAPGDCKLDTKPQPQWATNWLGNTSRAKIYNDWAKMIGLKTTEPVFKGDYTLNSGTTLQPRLYVFNDALPTTQLKNIVVLTNFDVTSQSVTANFPYPGTWYNLMDNTQVNVTNTAMTITIAPGQFRLYGNQQATLSNEDFQAGTKLTLYPNPSSYNFTINANTNNVQIFSITGQLVKSFKNSFTESSQFNISDLNSGIYIVRITNDAAKTATLKLIKQ